MHLMTLKIQQNTITKGFEIGVYIWIYIDGFKTLLQQRSYI